MNVYFLRNLNKEIVKFLCMWIKFDPLKSIKKSTSRISIAFSASEWFESLCTTMPKMCKPEELLQFMHPMSNFHWNKWDAILEIHPWFSHVSRSMSLNETHAVRLYTGWTRLWCSLKTTRKQEDTLSQWQNHCGTILLLPIMFSLSKSSIALARYLPIPCTCEYYAHLNNIHCYTYFMEISDCCSELIS